MCHLEVSDVTAMRVAHQHGCHVVGHEVKSLEEGSREQESDVIILRFQKI